MQDVDVQLDLLRSQVRISKDLTYLPFSKYEHWSKLLDELGRMIGGWFKSLNTKDSLVK